MLDFFFLLDWHHADYVIVDLAKLLLKLLQQYVAELNFH